MAASSPRATDPGRPRRQSGQSVIELALALPALLTLLFGMLNIGALITDKMTAGYAARQGARLAAQLGNGMATGMSTLEIDRSICQTVKASAANLAYATLTEIDIYNARDASTASSNGSLIQPPGSGALYDSYDPNSTPPCNQLHQSFPATASGTPVRVQVPPNETSIGVNVKWQYSVPLGYTSFAGPYQARSFSLAISDYAVMTAAPVLG